MSKKFKVMNHKPEATDEEIQNYMNFQGLMTKHAEAVSSARTSSILKKTIGGVIILATAVVVIWFLTRTPENNINSQSQLHEETLPSTPTEKSQPILEPSHDDSKDVSKESSSAEEKPKSSIEPRQSNEVKSETVTPAEEEKKQGEQSYVQAEPVTGYPELYDYFSKNLVYPKEAMKDSIQGVLTIAFVVNTQGRPEKIQIVNSLGPLFDAEARRLVENMPDWKPALMNGEPVPSKISLPVTFQLVKVKAH